MSYKSQVKKTVFVNDNFDRETNFREINANFSFPVIIKTKLLDWQVSQKAGIKQKCLERVGRKISRLTILAQITTGRTFKKFGHENGVEFLVLSGVFSDADGDYSAGCYVRNPANTYFEPFTRDGCTVLFKLGQFQPLDRKKVVIATREPDAIWQSAGEPGVSCLDLHQFAEETVSLYRIRTECWVTFKNINQSVEVFVCEGSITVDGDYFDTGTWLRYPPGGKVKISSKKGACLYVKKNIFPG